MAVIRVAALIVSFLAASVVAAQCVSDVRRVPSNESILPGPIAWSGRVLAVAGTQAVEDSHRLFVTTFDNNGNQLSPMLLVPDSTGAELIALIWNGSEFALFFENAQHELILRRVGADGTLLGGAIRRYRLTLDEGDRVDVVWSPIWHRYLLARTATVNRDGVWLTTLEIDGDLEHDIRLDDVGTDSPLDVVETETGMIAVFYQEDRGDYLMMRTAEPSRALMPARRVWRVREGHHAVARGNWFVLVRSTENNSLRDSVQWKWVDSTGNDVVPEEQIALIAKVPDARPLAFISTSEGFALSYLDRISGSTDLVLRLRRLDLDGEVVADTEFGPPSRRQTGLEVDDLVFDGQTYLAAGGRDRTANPDEMYMIRWCPLRARIEAPRTANVGEVVTFTAIPEGGVQGYSYHWDAPGEIASGRIYERAFTQPGNYEVTLTVRDQTFTPVTETFTIEILLDTPGDPGAGRRRAVRK